MHSTTAAALFRRFKLPKHVEAVLRQAPSVILPKRSSELFDLALGEPGANRWEVAYDVPDKGRVVEAVVVRCKNGVAVNYPEPYMRRRDPNCMVVADGGPSDKPRYKERFKRPFPKLRQSVFDWLGEQDLVVLPFYAGTRQLEYAALMIAPRNAAFFAAGLGLLQGMVPAAKIPKGFRPRAIIYVAPPFRHTDCDGRQMVVHHREQGLHELFAFNLYPGPSAKKGVYGMLLTIGESEGWLTLHGSSVQVVTPYDNLVTLMHEGASGGGKSEFLEYPHREADGRLLLGTNVLSGEQRHVSLTQGCALYPVTDDMAITHPRFQRRSKKLVVTDAEKAWFVRVNHITDYGVDPHLERLCTQPREPLVFLNVDAVPDSTCLIWEHIEDSPGNPCPNPRVILPRRTVPGIVNGCVKVDVRSFGVRTPPCTRERPSYGILGLFHFLPPALAWLWRLGSPRGHDNPSITEGAGLSSEGVGSYWPFATGRRVVHANLLLQQIIATPATRYVLVPNQHIGAWKVNFMPQWLMREYLPRRGGAKFRPQQLKPARCPLLGHALFFMQIEGTQIPHWFLEVDQQAEVGPEAYDEGARMLQEFFAAELRPYLKAGDLDPLGRTIIKACLDGASLADYEALLPLRSES